MLSDTLHVIVFAVLLGVAVLTALLSLLFEQVQAAGWVSGFFQNFSTEMFGALALFIVIDMFIREVREHQQIHQEIRSHNKDIVHAALERARWKGLLCSSDFLYRQYFSHVNWAGCNLSGINFARSHIAHSDLRGADFTSAKLTGMTIECCKFDDTTVLPNGEKMLSVDDLIEFTGYETGECTRNRWESPMMADAANDRHQT